MNNSTTCNVLSKQRERVKKAIIYWGQPISLFRQPRSQDFFPPRRGWAHRGLTLSPAEKSPGNEVALLYVRTNCVSNRWFALTWPATTLNLKSKRNYLHKNGIQLLSGCFVPSKWPPFLSFGLPIWPPWRHVKKICTDHVMRLWGLAFLRFLSLRVHMYA